MSRFPAKSPLSDVQQGKVYMLRCRLKGYHYFNKKGNMRLWGLLDSGFYRQNSTRITSHHYWWGKLGCDSQSGGFQSLSENHGSPSSWVGTEGSQGKSQCPTHVKHPTNGCDEYLLLLLSCKTCSTAAGILEKQRNKGGPLSSACLLPHVRWNLTAWPCPWRLWMMGTVWRPWPCGQYRWGSRTKPGVTGDMKVPEISTTVTHLTQVTGMCLELPCRATTFNGTFCNKKNILFVLSTWMW